MPNTDHSLKGSHTRESVLAFYRAIVAGQARPKFSWSFGRDGVIEVKTASPPIDAALWQAALWQAAFVEMTFAGRGPFPFKFTTEIRVLPERLPSGPPPELMSAKRGAAETSD